MPTPTKPEVDGDWWLIATPPASLDVKLPDMKLPPTPREHNACVDHHVFRGPDGAYHLWGCVRATRVGRVLYHWETSDLHQSPWRDTGEFVRADPAAGESINDWNDQEWLQSPYVVFHEGLYYMLYGGHATGPGASDGLSYTDPTQPMQMCLMTSPDGRKWTRHRDAAGNSRVFAGPGEVRDPCLLRLGDTWYCYYAGFSDADRDRPGFYCRTSRDLVHWSDYTCVHMDLNLAGGRWATECPHVVHRDGLFYLFRTESYYEARSHIYTSTDPLNFGVGDASGHYLCPFPAAAVEIYDFDGQLYLSSSHQPMRGTLMAKLKW